MGTKPSKWNMIWIFHVFTMKACEGFVSKAGDVLFKPASVASVGSNVSIICIATKDSCKGHGSFMFELNRNLRKPDWEDQKMSSVQLSDVRENHHVVCYMECRRVKYIIHMSRLLVGYPPDKPTDVKCSLCEYSTVMHCTWDTGQKTGLPTNYNVFAKNLQTGEQHIVERNVADVTIPVNGTQNGTFQIQIIAANQLNHSESDVVQVRLADIVIPITPVINEINILQSILITSINWRNQTSKNQRFCEVEYNTLKDPAWTSVGEKINKNNSLSMKKIRNANSLRVRCREEIGNSHWSEWSDPQQLPLSAPEESPDVWRILGPEYPNGTQEITILIRLDLDELSQRRISGYRVFYLNKGEKTVLRKCPPSEIQCVTLIPKGVNTILISAYNANGRSPASDIPIPENVESDLPEPQNLTVTSGLRTSMPVQWQLPRSSEEPLRWFILHWTPDSCDGNQKNVYWRKVGKEETNFTITDDIAPGSRVTISLYAVYISGVSRPSTDYGYTEEFQPKTGPSSITIEEVSMNTRSIRWAEIPLCDRQGFITGYTVYLTQESNGFKLQYETSESTRHATFDSFNPEERYSVCISASTRAGKGPTDHYILFGHDKRLHNYLGLLLGITFGGIVLTALAFALSTVWKRIKTAIMLWLPKFLHEEYPRVENSPAVKFLQENRASPESLFNPLYSDPEITEIQELLQYQPTSHPFPSSEYTKAIKKSIVLDQLLPNLTTNDDVPDHTLGYRPQVAKPNVQRRDSYCSPSHMMDIQRVALRSGGPTVTFGMQENTLLWNHGTEVELNVFKEMNLMLIDDIDLNDESSTSQAADNPTLKIKWQNQTGRDMTDTQDIPGDQLICTLTSGHEEFCDTQSYFPQIFARGT